MNAFVRVCLLGVWVAGPGLAATDMDQRLQFADGLYSRGMYELARGEYEAFLGDAPADHPKADAAHFRLGECLRRVGEKNMAEREFRHVFLKYPASAFRYRAGFRRAEIFMEANQDAAAVDLFDTVIASNPPPDIAAACWYYKGVTYARGEKPRLASSAFERVRESYPQSEYWSYALLKLGEIAVKELAETPDAKRPERETRAIELFGAAAAKPATARVGAEALYQQGLLHFRRKEYDRAAEAFRLLSTKYPADERAGAVALQAAWAAHNAGLFAETLRYAQRALAEGVTPERAEWLYLKANAERQLLKHDAAVATYTELLQRHSDSDLANPARYETALTLYRMGRFRDALRAVESVHATAKLKKDVYWLRAESHAALGEDDQAVQYYQLITREFPASDVAQDAGYRLAHHLQGKGDFQEAARQFAAVAANFPSGEMAPQALFASAYCLERAGQYAEAARDLATLVEKYPTSKPLEEALYAKAMNETRLNRDASATLSLNELLKRFPGSRFAADALYWKGVFAAKQGQPADAEAVLRKALDREPRPELAREAKLQLALALREKGEKPQAAALIDELIATPMRGRLPEGLLRWTSELWFDQGEHRKALAAASALADRATTPDWKQTAHGLEGRSLMASGKPKEAAEAFRKAVATGAKTPFAAEANLRLGDLAAEARDMPVAHKHYADAARLASDDSLLAVRARAYAGLGRTALAQEKLEEAARYFLSVAILFDDAELVPRCLYEAAEAFRKLGREEDRLKTARELKERFPTSRYARELGDPGAGDGEGAAMPTPTSGGAAR